MEESKKQAKNLFKKLLTDANSVFYSAEKINKTLLNKARKSFYEKYEVFYKLYARIEDQNIFHDDKVKVPFYTPFLEQKKDIDCSSALYSIKGLFELVHADIANIHSFFKVCSRSKLLFMMCWSFLIESLCSPNEKKVFFSKRLEFFYEEIEPKCNMNEQMRLQTDLEFQQREIMKLNKNYNVLMFSTKIRGRKAFAAEQKIREFKKLILKSK